MAEHIGDVASNGQNLSDDSYDANNESSPNEESPSPPPSSSSPLILYSPPTIWGLLRGAAINLILPFINGLMLGFGELLAHEAAYRFGWAQTNVFPTHRRSRPVGPGVEIRDDPAEANRRRREEEQHSHVD